MKTQNENGFDFGLLPALSGRAEKLVIILHGQGGDIRGWENGGEKLRQEIPNADVILLEAPFKYPQKLPGTEDGDENFSWIPLETGKQLKQWVRHVFNKLSIVDKVAHFANAQLEKRGLKNEDLGIVGFSMGGIIALQTAFNSKAKPAVVVCHGGAVLPFTKVKNRPDVMLIIGDKDTIFNAQSPKERTLTGILAKLADAFSIQHKDSVKRLEKKKVPFTEKHYPDQGHDVSSNSWKAGNQFLNKALNKLRKPPATP